MNKEIVENHKKCRERIDFFKNLGYDVWKERDFILEKSLPLDGRILEVGTGKGYFAVALAQNGHHFTCVDISEDEQKYAKMNIEYFGLQEHVDFRIADAEHLDFNDRSFDAIFAINMVHHLSDPYKVVDEFARVVKRTGKIVVSDFNRKGLDLVGKVHKSEGRVHPERGVPIDEIGARLAEKGFKTENHKTVFQETVIAYRLNKEKQ